MRFDILIFMILQHLWV